MAVHTYEGLFLLDSNKYAADQNGCAEHVGQLITEAGAELLASRLWEDRKLAYPIEGQRKGTYWLTYFQTEGEQVEKIRLAAHISEIVLRSMVIKLDPRIAEVLISYATGQVPLEEGDESAGQDQAPTPGARSSAPSREASAT